MKWKWGNGVRIAGKSLSEAEWDGVKGVFLFGFCFNMLMMSWFSLANYQSCMNCFQHWLRFYCKGNCAILKRWQNKILNFFHTLVCGSRHFYTSVFPRCMLHSHQFAWIPHFKEWIFSFLYLQYMILLVEFMSSENNYSTYRKRVSCCNGFYIPVL